MFRLFSSSHLVMLPIGFILVLPVWFCFGQWHWIVNTGWLTTVWLVVFSLTSSWLHDITGNQPASGCEWKTTFDLWLSRIKKICTKLLYNAHFDFYPFVLCTNSIKHFKKEILEHKILWSFANFRFKYVLIWLIKIGYASSSVDIYCFSVNVQLVGSQITIFCFSHLLILVCTFYMQLVAITTGAFTVLCVKQTGTCSVYCG